MKLYFILLVVVLFVLPGCGSGLDCLNPHVQIELSGFDSTDLKSVIVTTYEKDGTFTKPKHIQYYSISASGHSDTLRFQNDYGTYKIPGYVDFNSDYTVEMPSINQVHKINGMSVGHGHTPNANNGCTNAFSWGLDGKFHEVDQNYNSSGVDVPIVVSK